MSEQRNDGGPAFPELVSEFDLDRGERGEYVYRMNGGMTLRDYAAIHSTQPGCAEICKAAGVGFDGMRVYTTADDAVGMRFDDWFRSLSLERVCELSAMVRYAQADGMLKVRSA
jgi:hypothetical protein